MDETKVRAMLEQHFALSRTDPAAAHEIYHDDAVLEFPQSGERFEGVESFCEWRSDYPASTTFELGEIRGGDDVWVVELKLRYDDGPWTRGEHPPSTAVIGSQGRRSTSAEPFEAPEWRAQWRAAP